MEIVRILRVLRRHPLLVTLGVMAAVGAGILSQYRYSAPFELRSRQAVGAEGSLRVLVTARAEQQFDLRSRVAPTLSTRTRLLADLLATRGARERVARHAGIAPELLSVVTPSMTGPPLRTSLAQRAAEAAALAGPGSVLRVKVESGLPILTLESGTGEQATARRIVEGAVTALDAAIAVEARQEPGIGVQALGPAASRVIRSGPTPLMGVVAASFVLVLWCAAIVLMAGLVRARAHSLPA